MLFNDYAVALGAAAFALLPATALAAPSAGLEKRAPIVYIAGDSTTAEGGGGSGTQGAFLIPVERNTERWQLLSAIFGILSKGVLFLFLWRY